MCPRGGLFFNIRFTYHRFIDQLTPKPVFNIIYRFIQIEFFHVILKQTHLYGNVNKMTETDPRLFVLVGFTGNIF